MQVKKKKILNKHTECRVCFHRLHNAFPLLGLRENYFVDTLSRRCRRLLPDGIFIMVHGC